MLKLVKLAFPGVINATSIDTPAVVVLYKAPAVTSVQAPVVPGVVVQIPSSVSKIPSLSLSKSQISEILSPSLSGFPEAVASHGSAVTIIVAIAVSQFVGTSVSQI